MSSLSASESGGTEGVGVAQKSRILITGSNGQIGTALSRALANHDGVGFVLCSDLHEKKDPLIKEHHFEVLNVLDAQRLRQVVVDYQIDTVYHLSAVLSAKGEHTPGVTWEVNLQGWLNVLDLAKEGFIKRVFFPSTIAVFGANVPQWMTPDDAPLNPTTVYGLSKAAGENWAAYYHQRWGVDVRCLRYPGVIGHESMPGGGTTDYAVEIFHELIEQGQYTCFLAPDQCLPMIHMEDAVRATLELMSAPQEKIKRRHGYNIQGLSFTPAELVAEIEQQFGPQQVRYQPDERQLIAQTWPHSLDDQQARDDWGWQPKYKLQRLVTSMWGEIAAQKTNTKPQNKPLRSAA